MQDTFQYIVLHPEDGVLTLTMNRPEVLNAVNPTMLDEIASVLEEIAATSLIRCVILTGAGRAFGSGQDLHTFSEGYAGNATIKVSDGLKNYHRIVYAIRAMPQPVIAMVRGVAAGASCNLALACDLRIASEDARFIEAFARIGLVPDAGGAYFLTRLVGIGKALEMALLADEFSGREAERLGLVNRCVTNEELESTTMLIARRLAQGPTKAYGLIKQLTYASAEISLEQSLQLEGEMQDIAINTADHREGVMAFLQKRKASFTGQ